MDPILETMNRYIHAHAGRRRRAPVFIPDDPSEVPAPETPSPCYGCPMRDRNTSVPYCFLPVCRRDDILKGSNATHEKTD